MTLAPPTFAHPALAHRTLAHPALDLMLYVSGLMRVMRVSCLKRDRQLRRAKPKTLNPKPSTLNPRGCAAYGEMWQEM